jgi:hypothetical protein
MKKYSKNAPVPSANGPVPPAQGPVQSANGTVTSANGTDPSAKGPSPSASGSVPSAKGPVPSANGSVKSARGPAPPAKGPVRSANVVHEVNYKCRKQDKQIHLTYYLSDNERREVIRNTGDSGCLLLEFYLRRVGRNEGMTTDTLVADHFGWSTQKAKRLRSKLTRHGWFRSVNFKSARGRKAITYYVGKEAVRDSH